MSAAFSTLSDDQKRRDYDVRPVVLSVSLHNQTDSDNVFNIEMIQEMLSQNTDKDILQNLETFMNELDDVNDGETEEENN